jgi:hypothetical protein
MSFLAVVGVIGAVAQGVGTFMSYEAQSQAAAYNAQVAKRNEAVAQAQGQMQSEAAQRDAEEQLGRIRAAYGAAGVEFSSDALGVYQDSAAEANYNLAKIHYNTQVRAEGFQDQANLDEAEAHNASTAAIIGGIGGAANAGASILKAA